MATSCIFWETTLASLTEENKKEVRRLFSGQSSLKCLVSTVAFGMVSECQCAFNILLNSPHSIT